MGCSNEHNKSYEEAFDDFDNYLKIINSEKSNKKPLCGYLVNLEDFKRFKK